MIALWLYVGGVLGCIVRLWLVGERVDRYDIGWTLAWPLLPVLWPFFALYHWTARRLRARRRKP